MLPADPDGIGVLRQGQGTALPMIGLLKASARSTGGAFEIIEYEGPAAPPPHVHREREEAFYILAGAFTFTLGNEEFEVEAGSLIVIPRGTRHGFRVGPGGRALLIIVPAGLQGFFEELGAGLQAGRSSDEIRAALAGKYDSTPAAPSGPSHS